MLKASRLADVWRGRSCRLSYLQLILAGGSKYRHRHPALHQCEEYVRDADAFSPERWMSSANQHRDHDEDRELAKSAFFPFSLGPRSCIA
ncbi:hypothetical protein BDW71DRAFT_189077 [Aspergillus fruticulosus]